MWFSDFPHFRHSALIHCVPVSLCVPGPPDQGPNRDYLIQEPLNAPFLNGLFSSGFSRRKTAPYRTKSVKRPIKVGKRPINEGKRPIKAKVLVGVSVGSLMGCFRAPPPWRKTAPLKRPIKRSMINDVVSVRAVE